MANAGQMRATLGLDVSQFETRARDAANTAKQMGTQISRALDGANVSVRSQVGAFNQLRASLDPAFAAAQRYGQIQRQINGYLDAGVISQRRAAETLDLARARYLGLTPAAEAARVGMSRLTPAITNASFQVQDFAVQVAGGTAATTALAQQLPQLLGAFGFSGKIALFGAVLGTLVAIGAAVIPKIDGVGAAVSRAVDQFDRATGAVSTAKAGLQVLADNIDRLVVYAGTAATFFAGKWVAGLAAAALATGSLSGALVFLRGALIRTGIGALVVGAGELAYQFLKLVKSTGGFGNALRLLGDVAVGVWDGIVTSAGAIPAGLASVWHMVSADFYDMVSSLMGAWRDFLGSMGLDAMAAAADAAVTASLKSSNDAFVASGEAADRAKGLIVGGFEKVKASMGELTDSVAESERLFGLPSLRSGLGDAAGKAGGAAKATDDLAKAAEKWRDRLKETISPLEKYNQELAELTGLYKAGKLTQAEFGRGQKLIADDLADSLPMVGDLANAWADFVVSGGKDIEGLGDLFKGVLKQMIADAAKNQIMLWLQPQVAGGVPGGGTPGIIPSQGGTGGTLSSFGGLFAKDGWLMTGLNSGQGLLGTIGGWLGMGGQAAGTAGAASGIMGTLGSLGSMMGTVGAIIGGIGMVVSLGKKLFGRELKDTGISGVFSGSGFSGSSYKYYKGGLLRSDKTSYEALDPVVQSTIGAAYGDLRKSVKGMAGVLDLGTDAIKGFAYEFKISTKDMTEEEALQALQDEMAKAGSGMAELILGTERYTEAGETALDTLTRLSSSLTAVRQVALLLGHTFDMVGLRGGDVASNLAKAFGGAESMGTAVQAYWQTFYTDAERIRTLTRQTSQELRKMGVSMPRTREQYRALIESLDLSDKSSHKLYATLIGLSGVMDQILPTVSNLTREMERLQGRVVTIMDKIATGLTAAIQANQAAAGEWRKAGDGIRDYLDKLRGTASALISPMQARAYNQMKWMTTLASARAGDLTAAGNLTGTAGSYLDSVNATAGTRLEAARAQARVAASLGLFANKTETQADKLDRIATIQGRQLALIERLQALMDAGKTISAEQLDLLRTQLGDLDRKILRVNVAGFEGATSLLPKGQMQGLRSALDDLRDAILAETARQKHEASVTKLNALVGNLTKNKKGNVFVDDKDLARMARIAGIDAEGLTANQLRKRLVNFDGGDLLKGTVYDPTGSKEQAYLDRLRGPSNVSGPGPQWAEGLLGFWQKIYNNPNITVEDIMRASKGGTPLSEVPGALEVEKVKKKVKKFAEGGYHAGGLRLVGEEGPELEATGPSRIYSASQTRNIFDMTGLMREFRAMREELVQMREENRQLGLAIADNTRKMQRIMQKWDQTAVPTQEVTP